MVIADVLASEYGWAREEIWWGTTFDELAFYLDAIVRRKRAEAGEKDAPMTDEMVQLYEIIEQVNQERRR